MSNHVSVERMNEALDGLVPSAEVEALEEHFEGCSACRNEYARLSEVMSALHALPRTGEAPDHVWAGISTRITARADDDAARPVATVVQFPAPSHVPGRRTFALSLSQLAAAAGLVAVVSASAVWLAIGPRQGDGIGPSVASTASLAGAAARAVSLDDNRYVQVIDELEEILEEGRAVLAPETLVTIEESLRTVDTAIEEIETALAGDPSSDLLLRMLATHRSTKLGVLQRAAAAVEAQA